MYPVTCFTLLSFFRVNLEMHEKDHCITEYILFLLPKYDMNDITNKDIQRYLLFENVGLRRLEILPGKIKSKLKKKITYRDCLVCCFTYLLYSDSTFGLDKIKHDS